MTHNEMREIKDPRERFAKPPFPQPKQSAPGSSNDLDPQADYGEATYSGNNKLRGCVALITGADSGIGRAIAVCFAKEGADIFSPAFPKNERTR